MNRQYVPENEEEVGELVEQYSDEEIALLHDAVSDSRELCDLIDNNATFKKLVDKYTKDFALTQLHLAQNYEGASAVRFVEKFKARANFLTFLDEIRTDGNEALMVLNQVNGKSE